MNQIPSVSLEQLCGSLRETFSRTTGFLMLLEWQWTLLESPYDGVYFISHEILQHARAHESDWIWVCELAQEAVKLRKKKPENGRFEIDTKFESINTRIDEIIPHLLMKGDRSIPKLVLLPQDTDEHFRELIEDSVGRVCQKIRRFLTPEANLSVPADSDPSFKIACELWSKIDLDLFSESTPLSEIARKNLFSQERGSAIGTKKVHWAQTVVAELDSAKQDILNTLAAKVKSLFHSPNFNQIDWLFLKSRAHGPLQEPWSSFQKAFLRNFVGECYAEFNHLAERVESLGPIQHPEPKRQESHPESKESKYAGHVKRGSDPELDQLMRGRLPQARRFQFPPKSRSKFSAEDADTRDIYRSLISSEKNSLSSKDLDLVCEGILFLPIESQIKILEETNPDLRVQVLQGLLSKNLGVDDLFQLLKWTIDKKRVKEQKLFLQPTIYDLLATKFPNEIQQWIAQADQAVKKEAKRFQKEWGEPL